MPPLGRTHPVSSDFDIAARRADAVAHSAQNLRHLGFTPDLIMGHHGWGELLHLTDVWPGVPMLGYFEFYYHVTGLDVNFDAEFPVGAHDFPRIRAKNAVNLLALSLGQHGQTPTDFQRSTYPEWGRKQITVLPEGADLERCHPDPSERRKVLEVGRLRIGPKDKLVTYVARNLEPYRGFHSIMRALPRILNARRDVKVVLVGGDHVSYGVPPPLGSWRQQLLAELGEAVDLSRVELPGRVDYELYLKLLRRSDAHVYLTYPFVASWSLREALASGCAIVGSDIDAVREFITHEERGLLVPTLDPRAIAESVLRLLEDKDLSERVRRNSRRFAEDRLDLRHTIARYADLMARLTGREASDIL